MNVLPSIRTVYSRGFSRGLKPDPLLMVSAWANQFRELSSVASSQPGRWRTSRTPYLGEIMDCLSATSSIERVIFMKGAQIGGTEAGLNFLGYVIHQVPAPTMMVMPTVDTARKYSKQRINPMIESSEVLRTLVREQRSRDSGNTILNKEFSGGILMLVGANSASSLRSSPIRFLFMDEIDGYPGDADGEGDPVALAIQRTANFPNRKIFLVSTPTIKGFSRIEKAYDESDRRQYWVPCPVCETPQVLEWRQIRWSNDEREKAFYQCIHCEAAIYEHQKKWMLENGKWIAESPGEGKAAGFHLSSLYSPHGWTSWADIAVEHGLVYRDPVRLKVWVNTKLGQTWEEEAEKLDGEGLMDRREVFGKRLNEGIVAITVGVDIQGDRIEAEFVGWGRDEESWSIEHRVIWGDPSGPEVWHDLDGLLRRSFSHARQVADMHVRAVGIDTGGHHTMQAYEFCRNRQDRRVWAIKGRGGMGVPIWPHKASRKNRGKVPLFSVGVDAAKEAIYARLRVKDPGPGYCHFPHTRDIEWFRQLTAEKVATRYSKGRPIREWKKQDGQRNEALDCRVYAMAALHGLLSSGLQLNLEADRLAEVPLKRSDGDRDIKPRTHRSQRVVFQSPWM